MAEFVTNVERDIDIVLAIQGCDTACADLSPFEGMKIVSITSHEDAERFVRDVLEKNE